MGRGMMAAAAGALLLAGSGGAASSGPLLTHSPAGAHTGLVVPAYTRHETLKSVAGNVRAIRAGRSKRNETLKGSKQ